MDAADAAHMFARGESGSSTAAVIATFFAERISVLIQLDTCVQVTGCREDPCGVFSLTVNAVHVTGPRRKGQGEHRFKDFVCEMLVSTERHTMGQHRLVLDSTVVCFWL